MNSAMPLQVGIGNKDQYGNKIGRKHAEAVLKFAETRWLIDAKTTLETLLKIEIGQKAFVKFLKAEYVKADIDCYLEFQVNFFYNFVNDIETYA